MGDYFKKNVFYIAKIFEKNFCKTKRLKSTNKKRDPKTFLYVMKKKRKK